LAWSDWYIPKIDLTIDTNKSIYTNSYDINAVF